MKWEPIDTAPLTGETVLLWRAGEGRQVELAYWNWRLDCWVTPDELLEIGKKWPTHWAKIEGPSE